MLHIYVGNIWVKSIEVQSAGEKIEGTIRIASHIVDQVIKLVPGKMAVKTMLELFLWPNLGTAKWN